MNTKRKKRDLRFWVFLSLALSIVAIGIHFIPIHATLYQPGETLNPDCPPGPGCSVVSPATSGINLNIKDLKGLAPREQQAVGETPGSAHLLHLHDTPEGNILESLKPGHDGDVLMFHVTDLEWGNIFHHIKGKNGILIEDKDGRGSISLDIGSLPELSGFENEDMLPVYDVASGVTKKISRATLFNGILGALTYQGTWNASTDVPSLGEGEHRAKGNFFVVSNAGTTSLDGISTWNIGDWALYNGTQWQRIQTTNAITSVFGRIGNVTAQNGDYSAGQITFTPSGAIAATTVAGALNDLSSGLSTKEPTITPGTTSQYLRGDKTFQTLDKSAVGLGSVENTPLSTWAGSANITTLGTLIGQKFISQYFNSAGINDGTAEWNGSPIVILNGANITQTFNLGSCASNAYKAVSIYVRDMGNKARTINGTSTEGIVPLAGGAKGNITMKNSANNDSVGATFYCDGTDWLMISRSQQ